MSLIVGVLVLRVVYLIWLCPYELLGDEAYYWEWSRHLDLCYYEKGPGLAYLIAASTRIFGDAEWTVRLPVAVCSAIAAWAAGRLAIRISDGDDRAGFFAVLAFLLLPAFQANAQICTQDSPLIAAWLIATLVGLRLVRRWRAGRTTLLDWLLLSGTLGIGFLFKQSTLLFGLGLAIYWFLQRRCLAWHRGLAWNVAAAALLFLLMVAPMLVWNARHGWPTLAHTAGHAGMGGDKGADPDSGWTWLSMPLLVGSQLGGFGPPALILMVYAWARAYRLRESDPDRWADRLWLICCSVPAIGFFVALSFATPVLGSWPFASFGPLVSLLGWFVAMEFAGRLPASGTRSGAHQVNESGPTVGFRRAWRGVVLYGLLGWAVLSFPTALGHVPGIDRLIQGPLARITGHRQAAAELAEIIDESKAADGRPTFIVARYYMTAAQYAFYLPDHPRVYCAATQLGKRPSSYDYWSETNLRDPALTGQTAVLDGRGEYGWDEIMAFDKLLPTHGGRAYLGIGFRGLLVRPHHNRQPSSHRAHG